jgi:hypothetical protein
MYAVKLENQVNDKDLIIPFDQIKRFNHREVEIIIIPKDNQVEHKKNHLLDVLDKYKNVHPFEDISDVISWQRKIRDEWN